MGSHEDNNARWIRSAKSCSAPSRIISVIPSKQLVGSTGKDCTRTYVLSQLHVVESHLKHRKWTSPLYRRFTDPHEFHDWLESSGDKDRRNYVFCDNVISTLELTDWFARLEVRGCSHSLFTVDDRLTKKKPGKMPGQVELPDSGEVTISECQLQQYILQQLTAGVNTQIVRYRTNRRTFQWCRNSQYCNQHHDKIAKAIGYRWPTLGESTNKDGSINRHSWELAHMWHRFYRHLFDWWLSIDGGPFGPTIAAMSYAFLRHRLANQTILHHNDARAGAIENEALFSGRRSVWYFGNIGTEETWSKYSESRPVRSQYGEIDTTLHHFDIRSMYPWILSILPVPIRFREYRRKTTKGYLRDLLTDSGVIATVELNTDRAEYPLRTANGIIYPTGRFITTLCGPELADALSRDIVESTYGASVYKMGMPFADACKTLLQYRRDYRELKNDGWEMLVKQLSNALTGRLAKKRYDMKPVDIANPMQRWGWWRHKDTTKDTVRMYQTIAGVTWEKVLSESYIRPMGAAYAYLTAYGRLAMSMIRNTCPVETVIAQDTDGIWATRAASNVLSCDNEEYTSECGSLRNDDTGLAGLFYGPQHYWIDDKWILSGVPSDRAEINAHSIDVEMSINQSLLASECPQAVCTSRIDNMTIGRVQSHGRIPDSGWCIPPNVWRLPDELI